MNTTTSMLSSYHIHHKHQLKSTSTPRYIGHIVHINDLAIGIKNNQYMPPHQSHGEEYISCMPMEELLQQCQVSRLPSDVCVLVIDSWCQYAYYVCTAYQCGGPQEHISGIGSISIVYEPTRSYAGSRGKHHSAVHIYAKAIPLNTVVAVLPITVSETGEASVMDGQAFL